MAEPESNLPKLKVTIALLVVHDLELRKYSSYSKLCRIVAYCCRFICSLRRKKKTGSLEVAEIQQAERTVIKWIQQKTFAREFRCIKQDQELPRKNPMRPLRPFLDSDDLIRVESRLKNAKLPEDQKHPL